jgi:poly(A) polymerase
VFIVLTVIQSSMQEIELNKANWSALFEPFNFFEAYKNYLQVDIIAEDDADLRLWKGWVESRLRQLTLKVICLCSVGSEE